MCAAALEEYCGSIFWVSTTVKVNVAEGKHSGILGNGFIFVLQLTAVYTFHPLKIQRHQITFDSYTYKQQLMQESHLNVTRELHRMDII